MSMMNLPRDDVPAYVPPAVSDSSRSVDEIIASELQKLSLEEREKVYEDVHGVSDMIEETPEMIASCLEQMDHEVELSNDKDAYEQAKLQSPSFVSNRLFRLAFLRCTLFNPKRAAQRFVQYFSYKLETFGAEKLVKSRITLEDIGKDAARVLEFGTVQVLPQRDSKGRAVLVSMPAFLKPVVGAYDDPVPLMTKAFLYLMSTLSEDEETQKKGIVIVSYSMGMSDHIDQNHRKLIWSSSLLAQSFPLRLACLHCCYNFSSPLLPVIAFMANSMIRVRIRMHRGSHSECQYKLMSFGIPIKVFPVTLDGSLQLANHVKWIEKRRKKEAYLNKNLPIEGAVDLPSNHDVLLGRGKHIFGHPGNRLWQELVATYYDQYDQVPKDDKTKLADQIVDIVRGYSGRFRKLDNESGMWVEASRLEARDKVTHRFRQNRKSGLKGGSTHSNEPAVTKTRKDSDGGGKRLIAPYILGQYSKAVFLLLIELHIEQPSKYSSMER
eukprot:scaffold26125_cov162-Cylindrotheca_fusiformis.AAC.1